MRIGGVLATHAILYITPAFRQQMSKIAKHSIHHIKKPWDVGAAALQFYKRVYTPNIPYFYQSDNRESANKWQLFTDKSLEDRDSSYL